MSGHIRNITGKITKQLVNNVEKIIIAIQIIIIIAMVLLWFFGSRRPTKAIAHHRAETETVAEAVPEAIPEVIPEVVPEVKTQETEVSGVPEVMVTPENKTQEGFAELKSEFNQQELLNRPLTIAQPGYDEASFRDYFEYGLYPQWYADYPCTKNILGDSQQGQWDSYTTDKQGIMKLFHPSGQATEEQINRSTNTWGDDKPSSDYSPDVELGHYPMWYADYPAGGQHLYTFKRDDTKSTGECGPCKRNL